MNHFQRNLDMNKLLILLLIVPAVSFAAGSEEIDGYLCVPSYSTGFVFEESGKWVPTRFSISGDKYLLKKKEAGWVWNKFGQKRFARNCEDFDKEGYIKCNDFGTEIRMNRVTLRFQQIHPYGYVVDDVKVDGKLTPSFTIGTCSRL